MNATTSPLRAVLILLCVLVPMGLAAEDAHKTKHHHYKLIDLGTLGGPASYFMNGFDGILNNSGTAVGWADTSTPEPNPPNCLDPDCFVAHAFQSQDGVLADLGALPGGGDSQAVWISANGLIAGTSQIAEIDPSIPGGPLEVRAVLWRNGVLTDLGMLPQGGFDTLAFAVNSRGQVVGWGLDTTPDAFSIAAPGFFTTQTRAFLWESGAMRDLGTLGGADALAALVNERGQIVGISYTNSTPNSVTGIPTQDPFLWENGTMVDLGTLGGTFGSPSALNNRGEVVGQSNLAGDLTSHPFLWTKTGGMEDLGTLGGNNGVTNWINDAGAIAGKADLPGPLPQNHDAVLWRHGSMIDLGTLPGDACANADYVNDRGQVVGTSENSELCRIPTGEHAFLWESGGPMVDLNTLIAAGSSLELTFAFSINDRGEIVGTGVPSGCTPANIDFCGHAYMLIPCDENHPNIEGCDYSLVDAKTAAAADAAGATRDSKLSAAGQARASLSPTQALAAAHESNPVRQLLLRRLGFGRFTGSVFQVPSDAAGTTGPGATLSPGSLGFSTQAVGTTSAADTVALKNTGTTTLSTSGIAITGIDRADFAQTHTCGSSLAAGASCRISVTFRPTASGTRTAILSVTDNAAGSPQKVSLTGTGTTAQLSPGSLNFGTVTIGVTTPAHTVTLTNVGTTTLTVSGIAITGSNAGDFAQTHTCGSSLAARASCSISVTFKPTVAGTRAAMLSVTDNAAASPQKVNLAGIGTTARPNATLSASSLTFGTQLVRTTSPAQSITLTNNSAVALFIGSIASTTHFAETNNCLPALASGSSCTISVTFTPAGSGTVAGTLSISDNAAGSPQKVSLSGTGATMTPLLNGYCFATCRGRVQSPVACPAGQEAKTPDFAPVYPCGPIFGEVPVDVARRCSIQRGLGFGHCETGE